MKTVTIADVAKHAGVSKSTISQYLNERYDYMAEKTKERIKLAIDELGYQPNYVARSLKQKSTTTIGVIIANILHEFSTQVIRAIEDACNELGFHIIVCNADDDPIKEQKYVHMLRAKQVDGIIIFPLGVNVNLYQKLINDRFPIVFLDRIVSEINVSSVLLDNEKAVYLAVEEFVANGYKKIGLITNSNVHKITPRSERLTGFLKALKAFDLEEAEEFIKSVDIDQIQEELDTMLQLPNPPEAILAGNDLVLTEILKYAKDNEINIPEKLAVIGIDNVSFAGIYNPAITTIAQPTFEMGRKAATLLLTKIREKKSEEQGEIYRFEPQLIKRSSC
jgi:LacI family transcriptional regulator, kdg operon repressor